MTLTDGYCNIRPVTNREEMHFPDVHISMTDVGERARAQMGKQENWQKGR